MSGWLRGRFQVVPGRHRPRPLRNGTILLAIVALVLYSGFTKHVPLSGRGGTTVTADVARLANVRVGTNVRVHGVNVGRVERVGRAPDGRGARIVMRLDGDQDVRPRADARASIWWRTLLGRNMYVDLDPGSPSAPPLVGAIPRSRTRTQVELDEVVQALDGDARRSTRTALAETARGTGDPQAIGRAIDAAGPAADALRRGLPGVRGTRPGDLSTLVAQWRLTAARLARSRADLAALVDRGSVALGVGAARSAELGSALEQAPAALRRLHAGARRLRTTLDELDPVARAARPGVRALPATTAAARPALRALDRTLDDAAPLLRDLRPAVRSLARTATVARPLVRELQPTLDRTDQHLLPWLVQRDPVTRRRNVDMVGPTFAGVDSATAQFDVLGNVVRFSPQPGERPTTILPCTTFLTDPTQQQKLDCNVLLRTLEAAFGAGGVGAGARTAGGRAAPAPRPARGRGSDARPAAAPPAPPRGRADDARPSFLAAPRLPRALLEGLDR